MPNYVHYATHVASLLSQRDGVQYAFLLNPDGGVEFAGSHTGNAASTYQTALVNVLQNNVRSIGREKTWAICGYLPTSMCIGMAHLLGVHGIWATFKDGPNLLAMKSGWSHSDFQSKVPSMTQPCNLKADFKWSAVATEALAQAVDPLQFTKPAIELTRAMERVARSANTMRAQESAQLAAALRTLPISPPPGAGAFQYADLLYTHIVFGMVGETWNPTLQGVSRKSPQGSGEALMGNNIAGIMLDEKFQIVAWALNFASENPTFHAETLMVQRFLRDKGLNRLPPNYTIYTSLQPCDMCGSFLLHVGNNTKVVYCLKDVNLRTVLTDSKTGTTERPVSVTEAKDIAKRLQVKYQTENTHSANLLRDGEDASYRDSHGWYLVDQLWVNQHKLTANELADLKYCQGLKSSGKRLKREDFDWLVQTERRLNDVNASQRSANRNLSDMKSFSPLHSDGSLAYRPSANGEAARDRLGFEFVKSADIIVSWANNPENDVKVLRAATQGVEIFEALVTAGLSTAYGLNMINMVIQKQQALASKATAN